MVSLVTKVIVCSYRVVLIFSLSSSILIAADRIVATPVQTQSVKKPLFKGGKIFGRNEKKSSDKTYVARVPQAIVATPVFETVCQRSVEKPDDSLAGFINEALRNNPELLSVRQDEIIHLAKSEFTGKDAFPLVAAYGTHDSQPESAFGRRNGLGGRSERDAFGFSAEQAILDWGENRGKIQMDRYQARAHRWGAKVKELDIVYRVTEVYWRLVFFQDIESMRKAALAAKRRERASVYQRVGAREARKAELLQVEAELAVAERDLQKAQNGCELSRAQLLFYLGRTSSDPIVVKDCLKVNTVSRPDVICIDSHPEMRRVKTAELAASTAENAARAGRLPKVIFRGRVEDSNSRESVGTTNLVPDGSNYQLGAYVSIPVGRQWVAANAKLNEAYAKRIQLAADAEALDTGLRLRIMDAQNSVEEALTGVTVAEKNQAAATENLKLRKELALIKNATRADVALAESRCNEARVGVLKAIYDVKKARAHLDRELGFIP